MNNKVLTYGIATVWLVNGLLCKALNLVPRHQAIVETILNVDSARFLTILIGVLEVCMALWILSRYKPKLNAIAQIIIVLIMNILEYLLAPHLLLWGKVNIIFAAVFVLVVYYNGRHTKARKFANQ